MGWFTNFVSGLTGDSSSKVAEVHHEARKDSGVHEGEDKRHFRACSEGRASDYRERHPALPGSVVSNSLGGEIKSLPIFSI